MIYFTGNENGQKEKHHLKDRLKEVGKMLAVSRLRGI